MSTITRFEDIQAWQATNHLQQFVDDIIRSPQFARDLKLRDQMRAAAVSAMSNIAEGFERGGNREFQQFLSQAKGSVGEIRAQLYAARNSNYISDEQFERTSKVALDAERLIGGFMRYLRSTEIRGPKFK
ncbi:MAG TPA: four helix bundle protein [Chloroflexota bacterium]|jgi:four helix bundle protein